MKFILLINVKMPTIVGILTFISRINDWLSRFNPKNSINLGYFDIYEQSAELSMKKVLQPQPQDLVHTLFGSNGPT